MLVELRDLLFAVVQLLWLLLEFSFEPPAQSVGHDLSSAVAVKPMHVPKKSWSLKEDDSTEQQ